MKINCLKQVLLFPLFLFTTQVFSETTHELYPVEKNNLVGFINEKGEIAIEPQFDNDLIYFLGTGRGDLINVNRKGKRGILNSKGQVVIPTIYDDDKYTFDFNNGNVAAFSLNGKCGYITDKNKRVINEKYERCNGFSNNRAAVRLGKKWALINEKGELLTRFIYDQIGDFSEGLADVSIDDKYGFIDESGKVVIPVTHGMAMPFESGLSRIGSLSSPYYFIRKSGEKAFDVKFSHVYPFIGEYAVIRQDIGSKELYGLIDLNGNVVVKPQYSALSLDENFQNLAIFADKYNKYGVINFKTNAVVVPPKYTDLSFSSEGLITFSVKNKSGLMDLEQNIILPAKFDRGGLGFEKNKQLALVYLNGNMIYIDRKGIKVSDFFLD